MFLKREATSYNIYNSSYLFLINLSFLQNSYELDVEKIFVVKEFKMGTKNLDEL